MTARLFVLSAASGAGKTTLKDLVLPHYPQIGYSVSATTRPPRSGEVDGVHYFFKTTDEFQRMIRDGELIEWNLVHGNYYGTPRRFIEEALASGRHLLLDLDVFGKINFDRVYPQAIGILILPPSLEELERRLRARATETEATIALRLENARKEIEFAKKQGKYEHTIINADLQQSVRELRAILDRYLN